MESTLSLTMDELKAEAGGYLGHSRTSTNWDSDEAEEITRLVETALRKFYFQASVNPKDAAHGWTFLKPVATVQLTADDEYAALPDDFGGFAGMATVSLSGSDGFWPIQQRDEGQLRALFAAATTAKGRPQYFAEVQIKGTTTQASNRSRLQVYPTPDDSYVLSVPYYILPNMVTSANPYPYGGAAHAETMKAAVRAAGELYLDNMAGPENANYLQCLAASIQYDRRHQPKSLGVNHDPSDFFMHRRGGFWPEGLWHPLGIGYLSTVSLP